MGYQTNLYGQFEISPILSAPDYSWLIDFNDERHEDLEGKEGIYGYYCQWIPTEDGKFLEWDGNEKFYAFVEWLKYLIKHFFIPKGYVLNGSVTWEGEENGDTGKIIVEDNIVEVKKGKIVFEDEK